MTRVLSLISIVIFFLLPSTAYSYDWKVVKVLDGDTVKFEVKFLPKELGTNLSVRVLGIDTPEKAPRAKCDKEAQLGLKATEFTKQAVGQAKKIEVDITEWDKYGGRVLGHIKLDGKRLSDLLIDAGLARPYHGEKKSDWCK
jgi:endonuclease YncB( thermonuclease family)